MTPGHVTVVEDEHRPDLADLMRMIPFRITVSEHAGDDRTFLLAPFWPRDPWQYVGSTRGFGAVIAYTMARYYRPEGVP